MLMFAVAKFYAAMVRIRQKRGTYSAAASERATEPHPTLGEIDLRVAGIVALVCSFDLRYGQSCDSRNT